MAEESVGSTAAEAADAFAAALSAVAESKAAGNAALKSADLPLATEHYEKAIQLADEALPLAPQPKLLLQNALVSYGDGLFATVDTADKIFEDYVLEDLATKNIVKERVGYEDVPIRFKRNKLCSVPQELYNLRLACLQNLSLVSLKLARASKSKTDFEEVVRRCDAALAMDGHAVKAWVRKAAALVESKDMVGAQKVIMIADKLTHGKDPEIQELRQKVMTAKGKGKGRKEQVDSHPCPPQPHDSPCSSGHAVDAEHETVVKEANDEEPTKTVISGSRRPIETELRHREGSQHRKSEAAPEPASKELKTTAFPSKAVAASLIAFLVLGIILLMLRM